MSPAVGLVIVSHSARLAEGVVELAREMAGADVRIAAAGGLDEPGDPIGTDAVRVMSAIESVTADGGAALVLMDLGSAVLSAETALDLLDDAVRARVMLCEAPIVEGAVAAAAAARAGGSIDDVAREARAGLAGKQAHLGDAPPVVEPVAAPDGEWSGLDAVVRDPHGLHARPAAAVVRAAADHEARVRVTNLTTGTGPADARSLTGLATLGALGGHRLRIEADGPDAAQALEVVRAVVEGGGGAPEAAAPVPAPVPVVPTRAPEPGATLRGVPSSPGLAAGPAHAAGDAAAPVGAPAGDPAAEDAALRDALARAEADLAALRAGAPPDAADIIGAQILLLGDSALVGPATAAVAAGTSAARAWHDAAGEAAGALQRLDDPYLRARAADVLDVGRRVVALLAGGAAEGEGASGVLVAAELGAADVAALDRTRVVAIAMAGGGPTSHAAIIARSLGIPAVTGLGEGVLAIADGTAVLVDGAAGTVVVEPSPEARAEHEERAAAEAARAERAAARAHEPAVTRDGNVVSVAANIGAPGDLEEAIAGGADGVGLLRTEFLFLGRADAPGEDEQYRVYAEAADRLGGRRLVLRTLDAGADKPLPYLALPREDNPFLGVRGLRLSLRRPEMLTTQLRAALRAAAEAPIAVMFPMVSERAELRAARDLLDAAREALEAEGVPAGVVEVGAMVEVPAAALMTDLLAVEVDFLSIGTNDLVQYVMAAERGNAGVAELSDPLHPAVLRLIARVTAAGGARGCHIAVCGEAASDPVAVPVLLGLGVDELSVAPRSVGLVKDAVRTLTLPEARGLALEALDMPDAAAVRRLVCAATVGG